MLLKSDFEFKNRGLVENDYEMGKSIGKGSFGKVDKVYHKITRQIRACKTIEKQGLDMERFKCEINSLTKLDHPNVVRMHEYFESRHHYYIITELCIGEELFEMVRRKTPSETNTAKIFK